MGTPWENGDLYGKLTVCHGKSPFLMGKSTTVSRAIFKSYVKLPECMLCDKLPGWVYQCCQPHRSPTIDVKQAAGLMMENDNGGLWSENASSTLENPMLSGNSTVCELEK